MPANKSPIFRHRIIDECLNNRQRPYPSLEDLARVCTERIFRNTDKPISEKTIEKDIQFMRQDTRHGGYGAPIVFDKQRRGYKYAEQGFSIAELNLKQEEWEALRYSAHLLYQYSDVPIFRDFKDAIEKIDARFSLQLNPKDTSIQKYIQFETANSKSGYEWIRTVYPAIRSRYLLKINYRNIYKKQTKNYDITPCLLKEVRNRWYMIGWVEERQAFLTFSLDRILEMETVCVRQKLPVSFHPNEFLRNAIGIMKTDEKESRVVLLVSRPFNKLLTLDPLHASQRIIKETDDSIKIELLVNINPEFSNRILSLGPSCRVISPQPLKKEIKMKLSQTLKLYS